MNARWPGWEALFSRRADGIRLGLETVRRVHAALGRPAGRVPAIHVVGTNGKGSTAAMAAHALATVGGRVGLYTSPHLRDVTERVRIGGQPVASAELQAAVATVLAVEPGLQLARRLSFFELLTLGALVVFANADLDSLVVEAGLGGRLDATRIVNAKAVAITSIALDHQAILGDGLVAIAGEKAAVMRAGVPAFTVAQDPAVLAALAAHARSVGCSLARVEPLADAPLPGDHQRHNAGLALAAAAVLCPGLPAAALAGVHWPGRLWRPDPVRRVVFDVAHNPAAIAATVEALRHEVGPKAALFACQPDKPRAVMIAQLAQAGFEVFTVALADADPASEATFPALDDAGLRAQIAQHLRHGGLWLVCGSHAIVAAMLAGDTLGHPGDPRGVP